MTDYTVTDADRAWIAHYGWFWDCGQNGWCTSGRWDRHEGASAGMPFAKVIPNPMTERPGWVVWLFPCGAIQTDAPWDSVRGAIRVAAQILQGRCFGLGETPCDELPRSTRKTKP